VAETIQQHDTMSLYATTDKASRARTTTSKDLFSASGALESRVPRNAKYANVKGTLDTGAHAGNVKPKVDRSGEQFRRINRRQLHQLMIACEQSDESVYELQERWDDVEDNDDMASVRSGRSMMSTGTVSSMASGTQPITVTHSAQVGAAPAAAPSAGNEHYLLLDVRDDDRDYKRAHLSGALHYPPPLLRRDHFPPQLYKFKNAPSKLIVLYDSDETSRIGLECATLFLQKGFQNIFLLTGGLKHFAAKYWDRCAGEQPPGPPPAPAAGRTGSVSTRGQALAGMPSSSRVTGRLNTGASSVRPGSSASAASSASASAAAPASFRPHMPAQYAGGGGSGFQGANPATSLAARGGSGTGRISPREALSRQQQQQAGSGYSQRSGAPETPASQRGATSRGNAPGSAQISSRAFR